MRIASTVANAISARTTDAANAPVVLNTFELRLHVEGQRLGLAFDSAETMLTAPNSPITRAVVSTTP